MISKIFLLLKLMRLPNPTGYMASFFPAYFGLFLTTTSNQELIRLLILFFFGSIITRGGGCIINDICDKNLDKYVFRTKDRPLANGSLTVKEALVFLAVLLSCSLTILLSLNKTSIYLGFLAFILIILYPLMKRIIYLPQIFLGLVFNFGALIGSSAVINRISLESFIMYVGCCFWTIGYDTIYGFMDIKDDKKIKVKSMSILLEEKNYLCHLYIYYTIFIILFLLANALAHTHLNYIGVLIAYILLMWQVTTLKITDPNNCLARFKNTNYVGLALALSCLGERINY
ncbi:4-hydroxybenzoate octaprenyltransferase [Candidatus Tisiphia endosymbiont of Beris chalybata]|uniref:4-hydroxybenzoate octaprenyltransferase n=1 Tax=Candidatus Tisiphia endosymbiont of Beris chalybata TaxID=3066262 RepID=UPI00312C8B58